MDPTHGSRMSVAHADMDAHQPGPAIQRLSVLSPHSLEENYSDNHKTQLEIARKALYTCIEDHQPTCPTYPFGSKDFLLTRLIDLENLERLRVIVTADTTIKDRRYVPLSHCWGSPDCAERKSMTTTSANLLHRMEGFELSTLPLRYKEVILICRAMGVQYIWIDSLCIVQVDIR